MQQANSPFTTLDGLTSVMPVFIFSMPYDPHCTRQNGWKGGSLTRNYSQCVIRLFRLGRLGGDLLSHTWLSGEEKMNTLWFILNILEYNPVCKVQLQ